MRDDLILVIEDNDRNRKLVSDVLEFAGMRVLSAGTAAEGLAIARRELPSLVLMDIGLPDCDGTEALIALREHPDLARWWIRMETMPLSRKQGNGGLFRHDRPDYAAMLYAVEHQAAIDFGEFDDQMTCGT
jgi:CheY-like chemotaxis protein